MLRFPGARQSFRMVDILSRFSLKDAKFEPAVILGGLAIWALVVACAISSILKQPFTRQQRLFWICLVIGLPFIGVLAYLPFSFRREELPQIFMGKPRDRTRRGDSPGGRPR